METGTGQKLGKPLRKKKFFAGIGVARPELYYGFWVLWSVVGS